MKKSIALIFAASTLLVAGCATTHHGAQWQYKNLTILGSAPDQNPELNQLGKEGWSVVGFSYVPGDSTHNTEYHYVLKHKLQ